MKENKISRRAGYAASAFAIALLAIGTGYYAVAGNAPTWMPMFMGWCMVLAACSGVVCLVSAFFQYIRDKRSSARDAGVPTEESSRRNS